MRENPFEPPKTIAPVQAVALADESKPRSRKSARMAFRAITVGLMAPALYNYLEYDANIIMGSGLPSWTVFGFRAINLAAIFGGALAIWFLGYALLERVSLMLDRLFARQTSQTQWQELFYQAIYRAAILALPGAVLWLLWVFGFYRMHINFTTISWAVGVPAHVLGACAYLPLLYGWYRLPKSPD